MSDTKKTELELELARLSKRNEEHITVLEQLKDENRALRAAMETPWRRARSMPERAGARPRGSRDPAWRPGPRDARAKRTGAPGCAHHEIPFCQAAPWALGCSMPPILNGACADPRQRQVLGHDRIAVMAALNLAHEFLRDATARPTRRRCGTPRAGATQRVEAR
jgi:hypothetical protein